MPRYAHYNRLNYPPALKITFMSYSMHKGEPDLHIPVVQRVKCHELVPPPIHILRRSHGLNPELSRAFFALPANENAYHEALALLQSNLRQVPIHVTHVAVLTSCRAGMHRSVAMAERLANEVGGWYGVRVGRCHHIDLRDSIGLASGRVMDLITGISRLEGQRNGERPGGGECRFGGCFHMHVC